MSDMQIILVDDDADLLAALSEAYELSDISVRPFRSALEALKVITPELEGAIVTDVRMPDMDGIELFQKVREIDSKIPVVMITGHADVPMVLSMLKEGVFDFLDKPLNVEELMASSQRALENRRLVLENRELRQLADHASEGSELIGDTKAITQLRDIVRQVAKADVDVLIEGETGTEKLEVAKLIHRLSHQSNDPFIKVDCAALTPENGTAQLFGRDKEVARPYSRQPKQGLIAASNRGILCLDKIDNIPSILQGQLLPVVENREITVAGENQARRLDLRIIATCTRDLITLVDARDFSSDLYYRLNTVKLNIPPLRERREDIPMLFAHFLAEASADTGKKIPKINNRIRKHIYEHHWPGNIRELKNYAQTVILGINNQENDKSLTQDSLKERVSQFEASTIKSTLQQTNGDVGKAVELLRLPRKTFYDKVSKHGIDLKKYRGST